MLLQSKHDGIYDQWNPNTGNRWYCLCLGSCLSEADFKDPCQRWNNSLWQYNIPAVDFSPQGFILKKNAATVLHPPMPTARSRTKHIYGKQFLSWVMAFTHCTLSAIWMMNLYHKYYNILKGIGTYLYLKAASMYKPE